MSLKFNSAEFLGSVEVLRLDTCLRRYDKQHSITAFPNRSIVERIRNREWKNPTSEAKKSIVSAFVPLSLLKRGDDFLNTVNMQIETKSTGFGKYKRGLAF